MNFSYVNRSDAYGRGLIYVEDDGTVIMKGDDTNWLPLGTYRDRYLSSYTLVLSMPYCRSSSVRISSHTQYNTGLFILDLNRAPWGCGALLGLYHFEACL
jgi:hypothetical protein